MPTLEYLEHPPFPLRRCATRHLQYTPPDDQRYVTREHAYGGEAEAGMPAVDLTDNTAEDGGKEASYIDAGIVEGITRLAPRIVGGIKGAKECRCIGTEEASPQ